MHCAGSSETAAKTAQVGWRQQEEFGLSTEDVKDVFGSVLLDVQYGDKPHGAKPFGEGLPREIWKIVEDFDGNTYRAVYTAAFPEVAYVLDVFMKKSTSGIGTQKMDKDRVRARFNAAKQHYDENYRRRGER